MTNTNTVAAAIVRTLQRRGPLTPQTRGAAGTVYPRPDRRSRQHLPAYVEIPADVEIVGPRWTKEKKKEGTADVNET
jgi:hypothetical protein